MGTGKASDSLLGRGPTPRRVASKRNQQREEQVQGPCGKNELGVLLWLRRWAVGQAVGKGPKW